MLLVLAIIDNTEYCMQFFCIQVRECYNTKTVEMGCKEEKNERRRKAYCSARDDEPSNIMSLDQEAACSLQLGNA